MKLLARATPRRAAHVFAVMNIAFLGVDIALAHLTNDFARKVEWAPIVFSAGATLLLVPGALGARHRLVPVLDLVVGWSAIVLGVVGMVLHLGSGFFADQTLHNLVYSAPFVAPVSYVGVGLLIVLLRSPDAEGPTLGPWLLVLALGGFVGNFALSLLDHAQNGFFHATEWIPVAAAAFAIGFLIVALARPEALPLRLTVGVMAIEIVVGLTGFALHVVANLARPATTALDRFVFGAPAFAPMLFADLALLAAIGLWSQSLLGLSRGGVARGGARDAHGGQDPAGVIEERGARG
ncbi:MAG: hypothetical protein JWM74_4834 [Myxococcaceae bacterium]|nr:hypothetical protein [Myxococcaceae bacterium]